MEFIDNMTTIYSNFPSFEVRRFNKLAAVDLIRFTAGGVSRIELARRLGLTRAAITAIVNDLLRIGLVKEISGRHHGGRKPIVLEINAGRGKVLGVDIGASHVLAVVADFSGRVLAEKEISFDIQIDPVAGLQQVDELIEALLRQAGTAKAEILSMGVGMPGPVNQKDGTVIKPSIMPLWEGYPIRAYFEKRWNIPIDLSNDAELGALGEWAFGAGRGEQNLVFIKVGSGIGAGLMIAGQIYHGVSGYAGEIGHITIEENGLLCTCGNRGCLETLAGGNAIARRAIEAVAGGVRTRLAEIEPGDQIKVQDVISAARCGDLTAQRIIRESGMHLGTAIASLVNVMNPGMVIIGGGLVQIGDLLLTPIHDAIQKCSLQAAARNVRISTALLERRSASMGAVTQALSKIMHQMTEA